MNDKTLLLMVGFPRSGKTTAAKELGYPIVSPDAVRLALHGKTFLSDAEFMVWPLAVLMVKAMFHAGHHTVILDATNHTRKRREFWRDAGDWHVEYHMVDTSAVVCIARAEAEEALESPPNHFSLIPVIERMAEAWEDVTPEERLVHD